MATTRNMLPLILALYAMLAGYVLVWEIRPYLVSQNDWYGTSPLTRAIGEPAFSLPSRHDALMTCANALARPETGFQTTKERRGKAKQCLDFSLKVLEDTPSLSFAHFVVAISSHHLGAPGDAGKHIRLSQQFGQFEGWLAERRFVFTANQIIPPDDEYLAGDITTLLGTQSGAELLARYFLARPGLRPIIKSKTKRVNTGEQQRLLNVIRRMETSR